MLSEFAELWLPTMPDAAIQGEAEEVAEEAERQLVRTNLSIV
jgi:hypothetical protein